MENCSTFSESSDYEFNIGMVLTSLTLGSINLIVLLGNSLVITAVIRNRKLRTVTNIYIISLACADMLLAILVLPFSAALEVLHFWPFGKEFCSMWLAIDVLLCTASILNLCAISLDRYLAVSKPIKYPSIMSKKRGKVLVCCVWILSLVISLPPLIGWNDENNGLKKGFETQQITESVRYSNGSKHNTNNSTNISYNDHVNTTHCVKLYPECELTPTRGYRIFSALGSFYIPMFVMVFFYCKIYRAATRTASSLRTGILMSKKSDDKCTKMDTITLRVHRGGNSLSRSPSTTSRPSLFMFTNKPDDARTTNGNCDIELYSSRNNRHIACLNNNHRPIPQNYSEADLRLNGSVRRNYNNSELDENVTFFFGSNNGTTRTLCPESPFQNRKNGGRQSNQAILRNGRQRAVLFINDGRSGQKLHIRKFLKETKAAKTVAIIVGAFIICWFPFFTIYLVGAFCPDCVPELAFSIIFWLGYCNSMLNPFIYALFSRDFRTAFRKILICRRFWKSGMFTRSDPMALARRQFALATLDSESFSDF